VLADIEAERLRSDRTYEYAELTELYGSSRSALREALRMLELYGVIDVRPGRGGGIRVRKSSGRAFWNMSTLYFQLDKAKLEHVVSAQLALEPAVARIAATNGDPTAIARLVANVVKFEAACREGAAYPEVLELSNEFHLSVAEASGNPLLVLYCSSLREIYVHGLAGADFPGNALSSVCAAHRAIAEAIASANGDLAENRMRHHMQEYLRYWDQRVPGLLEARIRFAFGGDSDVPGFDIQDAPA
jgi:DNA-binding FadR family transcriptional regulator